MRGCVLPPVEIRADAGYQLELVQSGGSPLDFRPMLDAGNGVVEIRVHGEVEYRVFFVARFEETIYVLHCFAKKTQATRKAHLEAGRKRYKEIVERRKARGL